MKLATLFRKFQKNNDPSINKDCTEFEVNKTRISEFIIDDIVPIVGVSPFPLDELMLMVSSMCRLKPTHVFEWGTHVGKSARIFHETNGRFGIGAEIHSIDLPDDVEHVEHPGRRRGDFVRNIKGIHLHQGDGLDIAMEIFRTSAEACRPLFFLDGDHSYQSVKRELETIVNTVPTPAILVHDTFYQSPGAKYNVGPYKAIIDTIDAFPDQYKILFTHMGLPGMSFIFKLP